VQGVEVRVWNSAFTLYERRGSYSSVYCVLFAPPSHSGVRAHDLGCGISGLGFAILDLALRILGFWDFKISRFRVHG